MASYDFSAPRLYVDSALATGSVLSLDKAQQHYLAHVLRLSEGDDVLIFNGCDGEWRAAVAPGASRKQVALVVADRVRMQTAAADLHYLFAPLKHARLDYMVQKAVELGASVLRPLQTRRTQVTRLNSERMRANAIEAAEQCGLLALPHIMNLATLDAALASWEPARTLVFCDEDADVSGSMAALATLRRGSPLAVLIGPEGGFDPAERDAILALAGSVRLSLGPRILRADTAAVAALSLVQATAGDWSQPEPSPGDPHAANTHEADPQGSRASRSRPIV